MKITFMVVMMMALTLQGAVLDLTPDTVLVQSPTQTNQAATKAYVDAHSGDSSYTFGATNAAIGFYTNGTEVLLGTNIETIVDDVSWRSSTDTWNIVTGKLDIVGTNNFIKLSEVPADNLAWQSNAVDSVARANITATSNAIPTSAAQINGLTNAAAFDAAGAALAVSNAFTNTAALALTALQAVRDGPVSIISTERSDFRLESWILDYDNNTGSTWSPTIGFVLSYDHITNWFGLQSGLLGRAGFARYPTYDAFLSYGIHDDGNFLAGTHYLAPSGNGSNLTGITAAQVGASPTGHVHNASSVTNLDAVIGTQIGASNFPSRVDATNIALAVVAPWTNQVTAASIVGAGGKTNVTVTATTNSAGVASASAANGLLTINIGTNVPASTGGGGMVSLGTATYTNGTFSITNMTAPGLCSFTPPNDVPFLSIAASPYFRTAYGVLSYGSAGARALNRGVEYQAITSSNVLSVIGHAFIAETNFASLSTNNYVATYGTIVSNVLGVIAANNTNGYSTNSITATNAPGSSAFFGGVLLPDGRVFCVPFNSTSARIYNPVTDTLSTPTGTYPGSTAFYGGVLLPDGRVFCVPGNSTSARIYNPVTDTLSTPTGTYPGSIAFYGGVLLPDGRVFCVPANSTSARIYNPVTDTLSTPTGTYPGSGAFYGGVLLPDGRVFCVPANSTSARIYNPVTDTLSTPTGTYPGTGAFYGGVLLPDGRVFCVPGNSTSAIIATPASSVTYPIQTLLGPTYNKF